MQINTKELKAAIEAMKRQAAQYKQSSYAEYVSFMAGTGRLTLRNLTMKRVLTAHGSEDQGEAHPIKIKDIAGLLGACTDELIEIDLRGDIISFACGKVKGNLEANAFIELTGFWGVQDHNHLFTTDVTTMQAMVADADCYATDENRPILQAISLQFNDDQFRAVSADGYKISATAYQPVMNIMRLLVINPDGKQLQTAMKDIQYRNNVLRVYSDSYLDYVYLVTDTDMFSVDLRSGQFPDATQFLSPQVMETLAVDCNDVRRGVKAIKFMADKNAKQIRLLSQDGRLQLYARHKNGEATYDIETPVETPVNIAMDYQYLLEALRTEKRAVLAYSGDKSPLMIVTASGTQRVVMHMDC